MTVKHSLHRQTLLGSCFESTAAAARKWMRSDCGSLSQFDLTKKSGLKNTVFLGCTHKQN